MKTAVAAAEPPERPSIGSKVHYVSYGTPMRSDGSEAYSSVCRASFVTETDPADPEHVGLMVANPSGTFFHPIAAGGCAYHDGSGAAGDPNCSNRGSHGNPLRRCSCGWREPIPVAGTWHWPAQASDIY